MSKKFVTKLERRGNITVSGPEARKFLQGLITNDINRLQDQPLIYACLLSPQGKFQYDFFIYNKDEDTFCIDCEGGERAENLSKKLSMFKLRSDARIECDTNTEVTVGTAEKPANAYIDPRLEELGWRDYESSVSSEDPVSLYDSNLLELGVPNGSKDMVPDKSTVIESWLHKLNAVSFDKGCYMGQELVARMYYRGLAKKHLYPVKIKDQTPIQTGQNIKTHDEKLAGEMRSTSGQHGMALLKDKLFETLESEGPVFPYKPDWMK